MVGDVSAAIKVAESQKFYPEKRSRLLKLLEVGTLRHMRGDYYQSLKAFEKARDLSDKLFTVSISKKALAAVTNNNMDNYYGEVYERSLIRFYIALNHYLLYQQGLYEAHHKKVKKKNKEGKMVIESRPVPEKVLSAKEKKFHLSGARAVILEWDSALGSYQSKLAGETAYKRDLTSRIFGGFIHEQIGTRNDRQVAIKLYQEAKDIVFKNYNIYPSYNLNFKKFIKDFTKLPTLSKKQVRTNYVTASAFSTDLMRFLDERIKALKSRKNRHKPNVVILTQQGYIAEKRARKIHIPIPGGAFSGSDRNIVSFAGMMLNASRGTMPSITFELPEVAKKRVQKDIVLVIKDDKGQEVSREKAILMNPLSEIAYQALDSKIGSTYTKIGTRIALKHVAALLAAYAVYKKNDQLTGKFIAMAMYATANKAIAASEKADTRYWSTLPHSLRLTRLHLKPGKYSIHAKSRVFKQESFTKIKDFTVSEKQDQLINLNLL